MKNLVFLVLLSIYIACGPQSDPSLRVTKTNIMHGKELSHDEYPFLVSLHTDDLELICSGSLLEGRYILTAAHCVEGQKKLLIKYRDQYYSSSSFYIHPSYIRKEQFDIALIELKRGPKLKAAALKIDDLNHDSNILFQYLDKTEAISLLGLGLDESFEKGKKKITQTNLVEIKGHMLVHRHKKNGSCYSDSGGPSFVHRNGRPLILGVSSQALKSFHQFQLTSFELMSNDGPCLAENQYSRVDRALSWIEAVIFSN